MKYKHLITILISTVMLTSCAETPQGKVSYNLKISSNQAGMNPYYYCYSVENLQDALAIAQTGPRAGLVTTVLQAYIDNYNKIINNIKHINAQSSIDDIRRKGDSYACWMPEMRRVIPLMTAEMQAQINPESYPSAANEQSAKNQAGEAFYQLAQKEKNKTVKLHDLLATYRYNPERKGLNNDLQTAYENATNHIIMKIAGDKSIGSEDVLSDGVIPGLRNYYNTQSLNDMKKAARDKDLPYPLDVDCMCHYVFDYPDSPQKTGTNFVITLRITKADSFVGNYSRTVPEERRGTEQHCYDVPVLSRDRNDKIVKTGETKSRCVDSSYTYTEDAVQSGTNHTTTLAGKMTMSINGRTILKNDDLIGYESTEDATVDSVKEAQFDIVQSIAYRIKKRIFTTK